MGHEIGKEPQVLLDLADAFLDYSVIHQRTTDPVRRDRLIHACRAASQAIEYGSLRPNYRKDLIELLREAESTLPQRIQ